MSVEENKALMQRVYEQVFNQGRLDQIAEFFSADFVDHGAPPPGQERSQGTETIRQFVKALHEALPDARMIVEDEIAEGAKVATHLTLRGTHQGEFMGAAPTGRQVEVGAIVITRIDEDGKIAEYWPERDGLGLMRQLGVIAEPDQRALALLREEGKIRHVGLSNVGVGELEIALDIVPVASVQNRYNLSDRSSEAVLQACEREGVGFIPWYPLATGRLARPGGPLDEIAERHDVTPSQVALAWLLRHSPAMLPIPGTSSVAHLEENVAAATLDLTDEEMAMLERS